jgi:hypothetical protein
MPGRNGEKKEVHIKYDERKMRFRSNLILLLEKFDRVSKENNFRELMKLERAVARLILPS